MSFTDSLDTLTLSCMMTSHSVSLFNIQCLLSCDWSTCSCGALVFQVLFPRLTLLVWSAGSPSISLSRYCYMIVEEFAYRLRGAEWCAQTELSRRVKLLNIHFLWLTASILGPPFPTDCAKLWTILYNHLCVCILVHACIASHPYPINAQLSV